MHHRKKVARRNVAADVKRPMERRVAGLIALALFLLLTVTTTLYRESGDRIMKKHSAREDFQRSLGGMGMGAVTVPAWNFGDFDLRLQPSGYDRVYPIPGGYPYSPDRLSMVSQFGE